MSLVLNIYQAPFIYIKQAKPQGRAHIESHPIPILYVYKVALSVSWHICHYSYSKISNNNMFCREEERRLAKRQKEFEEILQTKEQQLLSLQRSQGSLRDKLAEFERQLPAMTDENLHLAHEKKELLSQVRRQNLLMEDMKSQMEELRVQSKEERRKRAKGAESIFKQRIYF